MDRLYLSKQKIDELKRLMPGKSVCFQGVHVQSSPMLPFEITYDACDIESKMEIKIASGEWIHGVMMSPIGFNDIEPVRLPIQSDVWFEESNIKDHKWMCCLDKPIIFKGRMF